MGLGQVTLEAMEEEGSHFEKHVQSNDGEVYHWGTHGHHDENEVDMPDSFLWNLQFLSRAMCWLLRDPSECFSYALYVHIRLIWPDCSLTSTEAASLFKIVVTCMNFFVCRRIFVVLCTKSVLNHHNILTFSKLQHTECLFCTSKMPFLSTALSW